MTLAPTRPILRWHGGKWILGEWIISHFPEHRVYVEPFGGAASVLMQKPKSYAEIYNDIDDDVVNLFEVLRNPIRSKELRGQLALTPFSRVEHQNAYKVADDPTERARRLIIRSFMGFSSNGHNRLGKTGFRANSNRSGTTPAGDWANYPEALEFFTARLNGVTIEHRDALDVMRQHDGADTLHYLDPPYLPETRALKNPYDLKYGGGMYAHEMTTEEHVSLLEALPTIEGMIVLSGYESGLYKEALKDWRRVERHAFADGARDRTEVLWINPQASRWLAQGVIAF